MNDGNNFIQLGYYSLNDETTEYFEKPNLWLGFSASYDTSSLTSNFNLNYSDRTSSIDTTSGTINHFYTFVNNMQNNFAGGLTSFQMDTVNSFGYHSFNWYTEYESDLFYDSYNRSRKVRELDLSQNITARFNLDSVVEQKSTPRIRNDFPYSLPIY